MGWSKAAREAAARARAEKHGASKVGQMSLNLDTKSSSLSDLLKHRGPSKKITDNRNGNTYDLGKMHASDLLDAASYNEGTGAFGNDSPSDYLKKHFNSDQVGASIHHHKLTHDLNYGENKDATGRTETADYFGISHTPKSLLPGKTSSSSGSKTVPHPGTAARDAIKAADQGDDDATQKAMDDLNKSSDKDLKEKVADKATPKTFINLIGSGQNVEHPAVHRLLKARYGHTFPKNAHTLDDGISEEELKKEEEKRAAAHLKAATKPRK